MTDSVLPLTAVEFDPQNARQRTERSSGMIRKSLEQFGPLRSLVGQRLPDGRIIVRAGNGTLEEAGQIGIDKVRIIERRPDELVVVVADDLEESQWKSYAIADNRSSDLSEWDTDILAELAEEIPMGDWFSDVEMGDWGIEAPDDSEWGDALGALPDGDRAPFQQMTFTLHDEQVEIVKAAMAAAKDMGPFDSENENSNGNALARICETFLDGNG